jgi:hypothetical protein
VKPRHGRVAFLALAAILLWTHSPSAAPEKVETKAGPRIENPPAGRESREFTPIESYIFISEKNIFHPERKEFPIPAPPPVPEVKKPIVRPQVVLQGVTIAGEYESASVSSPGRVMKKGERELQTLRRGESIGDYKLAKILPDRIVLESPEDSFEVLLYDPKMAKKRSNIKTENKPAAVTSLGPTPASAAAPVRVPPRIGGIEAAKEGAKVPEPSAAKPATPAPVTPAPVPTPSTGVRGRTVPRALPRATPQGTGD